MRIILFAFSILLFACSTPKNKVQYPNSTDAKAAIIQTLKNQEDAWSAGDLEAFMDGYWKSEKLTFVGSTGVNYGWETTLDFYKKGYPSKEAMGELVYDILEIERLSPETFYVLGKFLLIRSNNNISGYFTLIWKYIDGKWVIVSDHSS